MRRGISLNGALTRVNVAVDGSRAREIWGGAIQEGGGWRRGWRKEDARVGRNG